MQLDKYYTVSKKSEGQLAKECTAILGYQFSRHRLRRIRIGEKLPRIDEMEAITKATGGRVKTKDILQSI